MSDVGWRADGIARARAAGGVDLDRYRRPGFVAGYGVRVTSSDPSGGSGFDVEADPWPDDVDRAARARVAVARPHARHTRLHAP